MLLRPLRRARSKSASAGFEGLMQLRTTLLPIGNGDAARSAARVVSNCSAVTTRSSSARDAASRIHVVPQPYRGTYERLTFNVGCSVRIRSCSIAFAASAESATTKAISQPSRKSVIALSTSGG